MRKLLPSIDYLHECFDYDTMSGLVRWRLRPDYHFSSIGRADSFNCKHRGKVINSSNNHNYLWVWLDGTFYLLHRVIWKMMTGTEPPETLDHKDRNKINNEWENLRAASAAQNIINKETVWSRSGVLGVRKCSRGSGWEARIRYRRKSIQIGTYKTKAEAIAARKAAEKEYYGDFAP